MDDGGGGFREPESLLAVARLHEGLGFGVWGVGFGVWGLGFRV